MKEKIMSDNNTPKLDRNENTISLEPISKDEELHIDVDDTVQIDVSSIQKATQIRPTQPTKKPNKTKKFLVPLLIYLVLTPILLFISIKAFSLIIHNEKTTTTTTSASASPSASSSPSYIGNDDTESLGTLTIGSDDIKMRNIASLDGEEAGFAKAESKHDVYEIKVNEVDGYTWYRIDKDVWVPNDGTWATFQEISE